MAVKKMHGVLLTTVMTTVTFFSFALPVLSGSPSTCSDGLGLNYTLPMFIECKVKKHPNGSMVQTIPKLIRLSPAVAGCQKGRRNSGIPAGHRICRFPDCDKNLCKNSWCEETMEGYECHCSTGFQGKHCEDKIKTTTQSISTRSSTTKKTSQAAKTPDSTTAEATTMSMTSPKTTAEEQSETTTSQAATTPDSTTPEATTISLTSPEITTEEKSETTPDSTTTEATTISLTSPEITTEDKSETTPDSTTKGATTISLTSPEITTEEKSETTPDAACGSISQAFNGSSYNFSTCGVNHGSAVSACSQHGSHLVYIGSQEEQDFIVDNIGDSSKDYWIGLTRVPATWLNGSSLTYDNIGRVDWAFNDGGECFQILKPNYNSNGWWYDEDCSKEQRYICEKEMDAACGSISQAFSGSCYNFSTSEVDHSSAVLACSQHGSHLVYIRSQEEQDFIMGNIEESRNNYWIGLTRVPATWLDGSSLTYDNIGRVDWAFNDGGECFIIYDPENNGRWYDYQCSDESRYICEKELGD